MNGHSEIRNFAVRVVMFNLTVTRLLVFKKESKFAQLFLIVREFPDTLSSVGLKSIYLVTRAVFI